MGSRMELRHFMHCGVGLSWRIEQSTHFPGVHSCADGSGRISKRVERVIKCLRLVFLLLICALFRIRFVIVFMGLRFIFLFNWISY